MTVTFRGKPACECLAAWLPAYERVLLARGIIRESIDIMQLIGGAKASAGTHSAGGAYDIRQVSDAAIKIAREMGAAAWHRTPAQGFATHQHGVLNGCPHNAPARYQIAALAAGYNGLGRAGRGGPDDGPAPRTLRTWTQGIAWAATQTKEKDMAGVPNFELRMIESNTREEEMLRAIGAKVGADIDGALERAEKTNADRRKREKLG